MNCKLYLGHGVAKGRGGRRWTVSLFAARLPPDVGRAGIALELALVAVAAVAEAEVHVELVRARRCRRRRRRRRDDGTLRPDGNPLRAHLGFRIFSVIFRVRQIWDEVSLRFQELPTSWY